MVVGIKNQRPLFFREGLDYFQWSYTSYEGATIKKVLVRFAHLSFSFACLAKQALHAVK
jgi:hypothetical protein